MIRIACLLCVAGALALAGVISGGHFMHPFAHGAAASAADLSDLRDEMRRVHTGKVDSSTMGRIEDAVVDLHQGARASGEAPPNGSGDTLQLAAYVADKFQAEPSIWPMTRRSGLEKVGLQLADNTANAPQDDNAASRTYVGQKTCETCHQQETSNWAHTLHAKIFNLNPRTDTERQNCEACHGPGSEHVKNPSNLATIISFSSKSKTPVSRQNAQCLSCHQGGERIFWHDSIHDSNNVACSDCHNPMTNFASHGLTARESVNETCFQCHKLQRSEFSKRSHMPLLEGKITCVDCHNPHGSTTEPLLKADSVNELCYTCHADKRGPFLFEHAPVRETCLNCHSPHGSNFENLLTTPRPVLCQQCHSQDGHPAQLLTAGNLPRGAMPDPRLIATSCSTCHVNIHGSNDPSGARFER